jgi:hypothetical protein
MMLQATNLGVWNALHGRRMYSSSLGKGVVFGLGYMAVGLVLGLGLYLGSAFQGNLEKRGRHPCSAEHVLRALIYIDYVRRILHFHQA